MENEVKEYEKKERIEKNLENINNTLEKSIEDKYTISEK